MHDLGHDRAPSCAQIKYHASSGATDASSPVVRDIQFGRSAMCAQDTTAVSKEDMPPEIIIGRAQRRAAGFPV